MGVDKSLKKSDALAFRVDGVEDVIDGADQMPKELHYGFPMRNFNIIESYKKAEINLACRVVMNRENTQFDLLIGAVPCGPDGQYVRLGRPAERKAPTENQRSSPYAKKRVFIGIVDYVESPKEIIPSSVWLERPKERPDFLGELFGPTFKASFEIIGAARKRECALTEARLGDTAGDGDGVTRIIQSGSEMVGSLYGEMPDDLWQRLGKSEFMDFLTGAVRVRLYDKGVWFGCEKSTRFDFDIRNMLVCANDLPA
jgi:hypothetical protein